MAERIRQLRLSDKGKLIVARQMTEAAIDSLYDPVIVTDAEGCVTKLNPAAEEIFGSEAENAGKHVGEVARDARIAGAVAEALHSQRAVAGEGVLQFYRSQWRGQKGPFACGQLRCATPKSTWWEL